MAETDTEKANTSTSGTTSRATTLEKLARHREALQKSSVAEEVLAALDTKSQPLRIVRCIGLGSPTSSAAAMYQLALLQLIVDTGDDTVVSLWDPVFSTEDTELFTQLGHVVEEKLSHTKVVAGAKTNTEAEIEAEKGTKAETDTKAEVEAEVEVEICANVDADADSSTTLYYMPHLPIDVLETIIATEHPARMLTNDLSVYTFKYTDAKYFELYPNCARIAHLTSSTKTTTISSPDDGFVVVKKSRPRSRSRKAYVPPAVEYDMDSAFFLTAIATRITSGQNTHSEWDSAFTDTSYYTLTKR